MKMEINGQFLMKEEIIIFPDPTFHGVFPNIKTQDDIWNLIEDIYNLVSNVI